jgi:hypothetical protein
LVSKRLSEFCSMPFMLPESGGNVHVK